VQKIIEFHDLFWLVWTKMDGFITGIQYSPNGRIKNCKSRNRACDREKRSL